MIRIKEDPQDEVEIKTITYENEKISETKSEGDDKKYLSLKETLAKQKRDSVSQLAQNLNNQSIIWDLLVEEKDYLIESEKIREINAYVYDYFLNKMNYKLNKIYLRKL